MIYKGCKSCLFGTQKIINIKQSFSCCDMPRASVSLEGNSDTAGGTGVSNGKGSWQLGQLPGEMPWAAVEPQLYR